MARKKSPIIFSTMDALGNQVDLYRSTWEQHIIDPFDGHPDMAGLEDLVLDVLKNPYEIYRSTVDSTACAFVSVPGVGPRPEGVRVVVGFATTLYEKGSTEGLVQTAYPIDLLRYPNPQIQKSPFYPYGGKRK